VADGDASRAERGKVERLLAIDLPLVVMIAEKAVTLGDVLQFGLGSMIVFDKNVDDLLELRVHDRTIARGEAVKIAGKFGLHVHEVGPVKQTIRSLGGE